MCAFKLLVNAMRAKCHRSQERLTSAQHEDLDKHWHDVNLIIPFVVLLVK